MSDTPAQESAAQGGQSGEPTVADLAKRFDDFMGKFEGFKSQIVEDVARVRKRVKGGESGEPAPEPKPESGNGSTPTPSGVSRTEMDAAMKLGRVAGKLPEEVQKRLDAKLEDGVSYSQVLELAEEISSALPKPEAESASQPKPTGRAASAASPSPSDGASRLTFAEALERKRAKQQQTG